MPHSAIQKIHLWSVSLIIFGATMDIEGGGYDNRDEGTSTWLEVCSANGMGKDCILVAIKAMMERKPCTYILILTRESVI